MTIATILDGDEHREVYTNEELTRRMVAMQAILEVMEKRLRELDGHEFIWASTTHGFRLESVKLI